jgi:predicted transcriptional regulator of viral defense system
MTAINYNLDYWITKLQANGKLCFSHSELKNFFVNKSEIAIRRSLDNMILKKRIVSIFKNFYVIIPAQFSNKKMIPVEYFIDALMSSINKPYYIGLLNASAMQGASHQQPQQHFVITTMPAMRSTKKKEIHINYLCSNYFPPASAIIKMKSEIGYINVSNPFLTALDLIRFHKKIGGWQRVINVLQELQFSILLSQINDDLISNYPITCIQRLGFILKNVLKNHKLENKLQAICAKNKLRFVQTQLSTTDKKIGIFDSYWNIAENKKLNLES